MGNHTKHSFIVFAILSFARPVVELSQFRDVRPYRLDCGEEPREGRRHGWLHLAFSGSSGYFSRAGCGRGAPAVNSGQEINSLSEL